MRLFFKHHGLNLMIIVACISGGCLTQPSVNEVGPQDAVIHSVDEPSTQDSEQKSETKPEETSVTETSLCPKDRQADVILPGVTGKDLDVSSWLTSKGKRTLMDSKSIQQFNARFYDKWSDLNTPLSAADIQENMKERIESYKEKFENRELMFEDGSYPELSDFDNIYHEFIQSWSDEKSVPETHQYILAEDSTILCGPHDRPYIKTEDGEVRFSRNNCSLGRAQSRIEILFTHANGMRFVRTADMWGWLSPSAKLSPEVKSNSKNEVIPIEGQYVKKLEDSRWFTNREIQIDDVKIPKGAFLSGNDKNILIAGDNHFIQISKSDSYWPKESLIDTHRPLTRNNWFKTLFLFLDDPYGWGGHGGWRDCSRLMMDTAKSFGIHLQRNSYHQARKTSYYLDVSGMAAEDKLKTIEDAAKTGIVLLHFKGHIMAWLGRSESGEPMVFHALSEYLEPCPNDKHPEQNTEEITLVHTDRVVVSTLLLGDHTPRGSYLSRITHVAVITDLGMNERSDKIKTWTPEEETLYSAFIERLFDYEDINKSWNNLGDILRDSEHNILYNSLGQNEELRLKLQPDCADLPYSLRTYFAWKRGLPMGVRKCTRGTNIAPPLCKTLEIYTNPTKSPDIFKKDAAMIMGYKVHSGNARTANNDDNTDFYPVELTRQSLRPGVIYADPYGHVLMIAHYTPDTQDSPGALYAVDAQPDGTITRKRFWRGNFLFAPELTSAGAGFKAFRPISCSDPSHPESCHQLTNSDLSPSSHFIPYSEEQQTASADQFYDRMEAAIHPIPLSIDEAISELTDALYESAQKRLLSVQNGDDYIRENGPSQMIMPENYSMFETTGPWEDFATPSRDMRMLIAIDAVTKYPDSIIRNAERYNLSEDEAQKASDNARDLIHQKLESMTIEYINSNGKPVKVDMYEITKRSEALEMAYHPADCNEIRWGAPADSDEMKTCSRQASPRERQKMQSMRKWFHLRSRPPR